MRTLSRRALLGSLAALPVVGRVAPALATPATSDRKFIFVMNYGGWDPLLVFAPLFGFEHIEMEADAALATAGGIAYVDHPDRPSVRAFFEANHARSVVLNGLLVPSVAHPPGQRAVFTGSPHDDADGDWPTLLGVARADRYLLPSVVLSGPSFPGSHAEVVCRTGSNGQLDQLLSGSLAPGLDTPVAAPSAEVEALVDRWLSGRAGRVEAEAAIGRDRELASAFAGSLDRAVRLKADRGAVVWGSTATWDDQLARSVEILASGVSRCVTMSFKVWDWDTHSGNDTYQSINFEALFGGLDRLLAALDGAPGTAAPTLAEETVVVVLSEMGRTPLHNLAAGRDHWPYGTALLIGAGLAGDRVVGGFDENYNGLPIEPSTGELSTTGLVMEPQHLGATLLALGDVDPGESVPDGQVLDGVLA